LSKYVYIYGKIFIKIRSEVANKTDRRTDGRTDTGVWSRSRSLSFEGDSDSGPYLSHLSHLDFSVLLQSI